MDEIYFLLYNQIESLQIQAAITAEHGHQLLTKWLSQSKQFIYKLTNDIQGEQIKEIFQESYTWSQRQINVITSYLSCIKFNSEYFYQQLKNVWELEVTRKELTYFIAGILVGSLVGITVVWNWRSPIHIQHMKAVVCQYYLGIQGVTMIEDAVVPKINKSNELLIQVKAAAFHEVDIKICSGYSKTYRKILNIGKHKNLPVILGRGCAGVVTDVGHSVTNFNIGDKVYFAVPSWTTGTMSEFVVISENRVATMPKILSFEASASLAYSGCIAYDALINNAVIKEGDANGKRILVYGGSTSVGCILIQLLKVWGGKVVTICRTQAVPLLKILGADEIILYNEVEMYKTLSITDKYDVILFTGNPYTIDENMMKKFLLPNGSFITTSPEKLTSDSFGFIRRTLFARCVKIKQMLQYVFGSKTYRWNDGLKIKTPYLKSLQKLADANKLQPILHRVYAPYCTEEAVTRVIDAIGSTVIKFQ